MSGILAQAWQAPNDTQPGASAPPPPDDIAPAGRPWMLLAAVVAMVLLAVAAATISDGLGSLFSLGGLAVVFGGVTASAFLTFRSDDVLAALRSIVATSDAAAPETDLDLRNDMEDIVGWARIVCGQGLRALERSTTDGVPRDAFVNYGLNLVVSDYAPDDVRVMLHIAAEGSYLRACGRVDVLATMASHAPAFGMVGTLIGMISLLHDIGGETDAIGGMLAVAFLSTLYGILSARMIYMPAAARLERQVEARRLRDRMIAEGMVMLAGRKPGTVIRDRLSAYLKPQIRDGFDLPAGTVVSLPSPGPQRRPAPRAMPPRSLKVVEE